MRHPPKSTWRAEGKGRIWGSGGEVRKLKDPGDVVRKEMGVLGWAMEGIWGQRCGGVRPGEGYGVRQARRRDSKPIAPQKTHRALHSPWGLERDLSFWEYSAEAGGMS